MAARNLPDAVRKQLEGAIVQCRSLHGGSIQQNHLPFFVDVARREAQAIAPLVDTLVGLLTHATTSNQGPALLSLHTLASVSAETQALIAARLPVDVLQWCEGSADSQVAVSARALLDIVGRGPAVGAPASTAPPPVAAATTLSFKRKLGEGAHADVWQAFDEKLRRDVAVKFVRDSATGVSTALDHARALARVNHHNVVQVHSIEDALLHPDSGASCPGVVLELVEGTTLGELLAAGPLAAELVLSLGTALIDGVEAIHARGVVHGDLHEENVLVKGRSLKIIDILYRGSLAGLSTGRREDRVRRDFSRLHDLLIQLVRATGRDAGSLGMLAGRDSRDIAAARDALRSCFADQPASKLGPRSPIPHDASDVLSLAAKPGETKGVVLCISSEDQVATYLLADQTVELADPEHVARMEAAIEVLVTLGLMRGHPGRGSVTAFDRLDVTAAGYGLAKSLTEATPWWSDLHT